MSRRIVPSYKDRFVITPYLYSYQVQPLETVGRSLNLNLYGPNPRVMMAGEHREDKEGECFVWFGHGGGLTPSGIIAKVRTCKERDSTFRSHYGDIAETRLVGKVYPSAQSSNLFE